MPETRTRNGTGAAERELEALAEQMDCYTGRQLRVLTRWSKATETSYRKRRIGPPYIRCGRNYFYPRQGVRDYLMARLRVTRAVVDPVTVL